jgi:peptidoglycan hydrolase CwlO-like protein
MTDRSTPDQQVRALYEETEGQFAKALEGMVARDSFGVLLAKLTENVVAVSKIATDAADLVLRNLRIAGRQDVARMSRQLNRTEDKLERVLQEVERMQERLDEQQP